MRIQLYAAALFVLCVGSCAVDDELDSDLDSDPAEESVEVAEALTDADIPIRLLTGDYTTIHSDWTATESGKSYVYLKSASGNPSKPWISSADFRGDKSIAFQVPIREALPRHTRQRLEPRATYKSHPREGRCSPRGTAVRCSCAGAGPR